MASSLFERQPQRQMQPQTNKKSAQMGTMQHPVIRAYQEALERGDERALQAQQLLSVNNPQQLKRVALDMLQQRGLTPEGFIKQLGLR